MQRWYGVLLRTRSGECLVRVEASGVREARKTVQEQVAPYQVGQHGGAAWVTSFTAKLESFSEGFREEFRTLDEVVESIRDKGFVDHTRPGEKRGA